MQNHFTSMADNYPHTNMTRSSYGHETNFEVSDFFEFHELMQEDIPAFSSFSAGYNPQYLNYTPNDVVYDNSSGFSSSSGNSYREETINRDSENGKEKKEIRKKVAFKTKSEVEILDDGFKWRKYGKKMVKNSPNPRNYYKCSAEGCSVKKRVERDKEDPRYVLTTYEGIHNHQGPTL
ncbi:hypothetical protein BUALT_Bualt10G0128500 [Buddleja alternifolia]|uniref:WRKY domain-containing protein n=1 Tax=Buddleja alternifolia TaxID=168488 RepID=A0AAV6X6W7_9LAMI|nr:hypothetical protein BUALT_Bualt10G0128500 [Buddleja alternifolia]